MPTMRGPVTTSQSDGGDPEVVALGDPGSQRSDLVGSKAAALAKARAAGLPVLGGFVVTTRTRVLGEDSVPPTVRTAWKLLSADGARPLVVRSSSAIEDTSTSSMAGQFTTVVDVVGWPAFVGALVAVTRSGAAVAKAQGVAERDVPMAILVQPLVLPEIGGVVFGIEPVTGRSDRRVIATVRGLPEQLVSGVAAGSRYETDASGRTTAFDPGPDDVRVPPRIRRRLAALATRCSEVFDGPQDIEWAVDADGTLWLLQSRPVTTTVAGVPQGPVLGPGPVGETFPDPLSRLEQDLWVEPLRHALRSVFDVLGIVSRRRLLRSPLVVVVDGRVAVDLDLLEVDGQGRWFRLARRARTLRSAWRLGRLRAALVPIGEDVVAAADAALLEVPSVTELTDRQLVAALERFRGALHSLHAYEMLVGLVLHPGEARLTASSVALRVLAQGRADGISDADLPVRYPVVVALTAPRVGPGIELPRNISLPRWSPGEEDPAGVLREALRLRVRWVQEAGARYAWELGTRLAAGGALTAAAAVRDVELEALERTVRGLAAPVPGASALPARRNAALPARFRLSDRGIPIPVRGRHPHQGTGAGGGRGRGPVHLGTGGDGHDVPVGVVLVVPTLDARLAPALGRITGLVSETGSVLAHLSILARESGVPVVVGLEGATERFPEGALVSVDGTTGAVTRLDDAPDDAPDDTPGAAASGSTQ